MLLRKASFKSMLITLVAMVLPTAALWLTPLEAGSSSGDFLSGFRVGLSAVIVGALAGVLVYRLTRGKWPNYRADERDKMIAAKAGAWTFYASGLLAMIGAVVVPTLYSSVTIRAAQAAVVVFIGMGLIYAICRIVAEARS